MATLCGAAKIAIVAARQSTRCEHERIISSKLA
jgi:hypothetical protein